MATGRRHCLLKESLGLHATWESPTGLATCLTGWAAAAQVNGQAARSARLLGAAQAALNATNAHLVPSDRIVYEDHLAAARARLDEPAFADAWAQGWAMARERVIEYALAPASDESRPARD